ncbi:hypothetical protein DIPPA_32014 [Diplonema papillatum]|nr:hypothetical protein DIPPA_32014 [Diplonema papillatum]
MWSGRASRGFAAAAAARGGGWAGAKMGRGATVTVALRMQVRFATSHLAEKTMPVACAELTVGVPKEVFARERRVAVTPAGVASLVNVG